jgi:hypothetical protein
VDALTGLEGLLIDDLEHLATLFAEVEVRYALVGASALLLHGVDLLRTTRDLDLAVVVSGGIDGVWTLLEAHGLRPTRVVHRFAMPTGTEIDILPLSETEPSTRIDFPDGQTISAVGLAEAIALAQEIVLRKVAVRVAPLSVLVAVKLHTATVRHAGQDLDDGLVGLRVYEAIGTRRFDLDYEVLTALSWETAGAYLAGCDVQRLVSSATLASVQGAVVKLLDDPRTSDGFARGRDSLTLLEAFYRGLTERRTAADP